MVAKEMNLLAQYGHFSGGFLLLTLKKEEKFNGERHCVGEHLSLSYHRNSENSALTLLISVDNWDLTFCVKHTSQN